EDEHGNIWFGTPNGVGRLAREQVEGFLRGKIAAVTPMIFSEVDGIRNPECTGRVHPSACKTRTGELWFGTTRGLVCVTPSDLAPRQEGPSVLVEEVSADDRIITARDAD